MDIRFSPHNLHLEGIDIFTQQDPNLRALTKQKLVHKSSLLDDLPQSEPGIYTITGGRQIGKTTLLKQWMVQLIKNNIPPESITYLTGELIDDHHALVRIVIDSLKQKTQYLLIDEITYISNWDKGIKYLADIGSLENVILVLTGSDLVVIKEARMRFPGRRGVSDNVDFHLFPLDFYEYVKLNNRITHNEICDLVEDRGNVLKNLINILYEEFESYLVHGGFLTAINDMAIYNRILPSTFATYSDWIRGDMLKRNKQEHNLKDLLSGIIKRIGSQITWNALSRDLTIDHPKTISDYIEILQSMDVLYIQSALLEDKLAAAPKKAKKVIFSDPFIYHATNAWLHPCQDPFEMLLRPQIESSKSCSKIVESCIVNHYQRKFPVFYIKAKGEVDIAYIDKKRFWPIEVKWTGQLRPKELKQISKYSNAKILTKNQTAGKIQGIPTEPIPLNLLRLGYFIIP
ncbi:MAG: ATP-binding protein [Desulfobacula sp.]|nr:ATP-binding protein [Desulfobacula sp.]